MARKLNRTMARTQDRHNTMSFSVILAVLLFASAPAPASPATQSAAGERLAQQANRGVRAHDPSTVIACNGAYWVFCTGGGIRSYRSSDLVRWEPGPRVLGQLPEWTKTYTRDDRAWAPDVIRANDGRYLLYYSASSWGKNTSAIGLISNVTLDPSDPKYRWVDQGVVVSSQRDDDFNAIDPAVMIDGEKMWLCFGSFWSGIKLLELDPTGKRIAPDSRMYALARAKEIEAPLLYRHEGKYYLLFNWGLCCRGVSSTYNIRVGRSERVTGPYLDRDGKDLRNGGGSLLLGSSGTLIGPGHASIFTAQERQWLSFHFYDGNQRGRATLGILPLQWTSDGWPTISEDKPAEKP